MRSTLCTLRFAALVKHCPVPFQRPRISLTAFTTYHMAEDMKSVHTVANHFNKEHAAS
jgi:hypothetical protein